ncbi:hypothetical protein I3V78_21160 [Archangium primigenium]|nr:hypothetical protein [Archangium primigenium]
MTLGLKGERPVIGTRNCKDVVHTFASANVLTGKVTSRLYGSLTRTRRHDGLSKTKQLQVAFCHHLLDVSPAYPTETYPEVLLGIDNAPWHRRRPVLGLGLLPLATPGRAPTPWLFFLSD